MSDKSFTGLQLPNIGSGQARNPDSGFARIYFKNDNLYAVLPNGSETQLSGIGLDDLNNVILTSPASGNVLSFNGTNWVNSVPTGGSGGASVTVSSTAPTSPGDGDLWWDNDIGKLFIYYNDGDTTQWVEAIPAAYTTGGGGVALTDFSITTATASSSGALSYNNVNGVFTFTPPDLSSYLTSVPAEYLTQTEGDARYLQLTGGSISGNISITGTVDGRDLSVDGTKLDGIESGAQANVGTNLGNTATGTSFTITSSTGNNTNLPAATTSAWGIMTDNDKTKLDGIETGADVTDAGNVNPLIDSHLNTSTATSNQVLSWTGTDYDWVAQSGGGGGALTDLTDVTIASVADGDLLRYNGTASEWQNTNLGLSVTPTLSGSSTIYFAQIVSITNWNSYTDPSIFAQVKNSGGTVVITNNNIGKDLANGVISFGRPTSTGSYTLEVQVQDFGDLASEVATLSFTVSNASFRYWRITNFSYISSGVQLRELKFYTGSGQTGTAYPSNMTSNTAPSPYVASGVNTFNATYDYYTSFDGSVSTGYWNLASPQSTDYVQIDMGSSITAVSLRLNLNSNYSINSCNIYGSNTGSFSGEEVNVLDFDAGFPYTVAVGNDVYTLG